MPGVSRRLLATACSLAITFAMTADARADEVRLTVDWERIVSKGMALLETKAEAEREPSAHAAERAEVTHPNTGEMGSAWFGVAPKVSFVARDWGSALRLAGGPIAVTDAVRVSRSSRMVMSRMRLGEGRVVPFGQLGLGQWRVDTDFVPHLPRNVELAAQVGGGIEMHLLPGWELAAETGLTVLYREVHEPQQVTTPRMWGTFLASRVSF